MTLRPYRWFLPHLSSEDAFPIGDEIGNESIRAPMAVLCPGTGLGIAGLVPVEQGWRPIATEGGHTSLSPFTEKEMAVWQFLRERHGRVSVERVLSGPGIVELYTALASLEGRTYRGCKSGRHRTVGSRR